MKTRAREQESERGKGNGTGKDTHSFKEEEKKNEPRAENAEPDDGPISDLEPGCLGAVGRDSESDARTEPERGRRGSCTPPPRANALTPRRRACQAN